MNKGRIFAKIIYYAFMFLLGILIAISLPYVLYTSNSDTFIVQSLDKGEYESAIMLMSAYYNRDAVVEANLSGGVKIVLFETSMENEETGQRYNAYSGFVFGIENIYPTYATDNNQTRLEVTTLTGEVVTINLLDYNDDGDEDGVNDCNWTAETKGYIYIEIPKSETLTSVGSLAFYDRDGNVLGGSRLDTSAFDLDFSSQYFLDTADLVDGYNVKLAQWTAASNDPTVSNAEVEALREELYALANELHNQFVAKSDSYSFFSIPQGLRSMVVRKEVGIIVGYFVAVYVIGDFLLGNHYIIKLVRWLLVKVFKVKFKSKKSPKKEEVFGHDYYSSVTVSLDLDDVVDFNGSVQIKYTNSDTEVVFILLKQNNYTATQRIKAGTYVNPFIEIDRNYAPTNLPENLEVEGYRVEIKIKIIKREV